MAFKASESYECSESCFDCISEKWCSQNFVLENTACIAHTQEIIIEESCDEINEDTNNEGVTNIDEDLGELIPLDNVVVDINESSKLQGIIENSGEDDKEKALVL